MQEGYPAARMSAPRLPGERKAWGVEFVPCVPEIISCQSLLPGEVHGQYYIKNGGCLIGIPPRLRPRAKAHMQGKLDDQSFPVTENVPVPSVSSFNPSSKHVSCIRLGQQSQFTDEI